MSDSQINLEQVMISPASLDDVDELLKLYFEVYGRDYSLRYGTDREFMRKSIASSDVLWLTARDAQDPRTLLGSVIFEIDYLNKSGRVTGLVTHPKRAQQGLGSHLVEQGLDQVMGDHVPIQNQINFVYATTRTLSVAPQLVCLRNGFLPLGIFPNAHRLARFETMTLMVKYNAGVLEKRRPLGPAPLAVAKIYEAAQKTHPQITVPQILESESPLHIPSGTMTFEPILAQHYVQRQFTERFSDPYDRFYPFHSPNLLIADVSGQLEIYAHLNPADGHCAIIALTQPCFSIAGEFASIFEVIRSLGGRYVEILFGVEHTRSIQTLLQCQFVPSALFPAMREVDGTMHDFVFLTRSMEPLNFKGMAIEHGFKPFVDQYVELWKKMHLETLEFFRDYE